MTIYNTKYFTKNIMEEIVEKKITQIMCNSEICTCDKCYSDLRALVLNNLPPKYVVSQTGEMIARFELLNIQMQVDIIKEIVFAINKVSENPRHQD